MDSGAFESLAKGDRIIVIGGSAHEDSAGVWVVVARRAYGFSVKREADGRRGKAVSATRWMKVS